VPLLRQIPALIAVSLLLAGTIPVSAADATPEYQVKAAFLLNFSRFVEWPPTAFASANDPFVIGIFGKDPFGAALDQIAAGKTINGRTLLIRRVSNLNELRSCNLVFFPASDERGSTERVRVLAGLSILTIGEMSEFAERGGMINFVVKDGHVRFEVNPSAAERGHLKVSSKLLQLAIIVGTTAHAE